MERRAAQGASTLRLTYPRRGAHAWVYAWAFFMVTCAPITHTTGDAWWLRFAPACFFTAIATRVDGGRLAGGAEAH